MSLSRSILGAACCGAWAVGCTAAMAGDVRHGAWLAVACFSFAPSALVALSLRSPRRPAIASGDAEALAWATLGSRQAGARASSGGGRPLRPAIVPGALRSSGAAIG